MNSIIKSLLISLTAGLLLTSCYTKLAMTQTRQAWDSYEEPEYLAQQQEAAQDTFYTDDGEMYVSETPIYSPEINYYYFDGSPYWDSWCYDPWYVNIHWGFYPPYYYGGWYGWYPAFPVVYYPVYIYDPYYWDYPPPSYGYSPPFQPRPFGRGGTILARGNGSKRVALGGSNGRPRKSGIRQPAGSGSSNDGFIAVRTSGSRSGSDNVKRVTIRKTNTGGKINVSRSGGGTTKRKYYRVNKNSGRSDSYRTPRVKKISRTGKSGSDRSYTSSRSGHTRSSSSVRSRSSYSGSRSSVSRSSSSRSSVSRSSSGRSVSRSSSSRSGSSRSGSSRSSRRR